MNDARIIGVPSMFSNCWSVKLGIGIEQYVNAVRVGVESYCRGRRVQRCCLKSARESNLVVHHSRYSEDAVCPRIVTTWIHDREPIRFLSVDSQVRSEPRVLPCVGRYRNILERVCTQLLGTLVTPEQCERTRQSTSRSECPKSSEHSVYGELHFHPYPRVCRADWTSWRYRRVPPRLCEASMTVPCDLNQGASPYRA